MEDWSWPRIGCILVAGVFAGAAVGLAVDGDFATALLCAIVAGLALLGVAILDE